MSRCDTRLEQGWMAIVGRFGHDPDPGDAGVLLRRSWSDPRRDRRAARRRDYLEKRRSQRRAQRLARRRLVRRPISNAQSCRPESAASAAGTTMRAHPRNLRLLPRLGRGAAARRRARRGRARGALHAQAPRPGAAGAGGASYCLEVAGIGIKDVDYVVFYDKPFVKLERILMTYIATFPRSLPSFAKSIPVWLKEKLWIPRVIGKELGYEGEVLFAEHHQSHAASAFLRLALRGGGDPDLRRRRRVGDDHAGRRARQQLRAAQGDPLPALARAALQRLHLLPRLQGQQRRVQGHGRGAVREAALRRQDPRRAGRTCATTARSG